MSAETEKAVDLFATREDAEAMIEDLRGDEPGLADVLCVVGVELGEGAH